MAEPTSWAELTAHVRSNDKPTPTLAEADANQHAPDRTRGGAASDEGRAHSPKARHEAHRSEKEPLDDAEPAAGRGPSGLANQRSSRTTTGRTQQDNSLMR